MSLLLKTETVRLPPFMEAKPVVHLAFQAQPTCNISRMSFDIQSEYSGYDVRYCHVLFSLDKINYFEYTHSGIGICEVSDLPKEVYDFLVRSMTTEDFDRAADYLTVLLNNQERNLPARDYKGMTYQDVLRAFYNQGGDTCVSFCKDVLSIHNPDVVTCDELYNYVIRNT